MINHDRSQFDIPETIEILSAPSMLEVEEQNAGAARTRGYQWLTIRVIVFMVAFVATSGITSCNFISISENLDACDPSHITYFPPKPHRKIFIDVGAGCGGSYYRFKHGMEVESEETISSSDWEAYLWEGNPEMIQWYLMDLVEKENAIGAVRHVELIPKAAATDNGTVKLLLSKEQADDDDCGEPLPPYGHLESFRYGDEVSVAAVDFLDWFKRLGLREGDIVHMKMDIDGEGRGILEKILDDDTKQVCLLAKLWLQQQRDVVAGKDGFQSVFAEKFTQKCRRKPLVL